MFRKLLIGLIVLFTLLTIIFSLGPTPDFDNVSSDIPSLSISIDELDNYIAQKESLVKDIKPDNEGRIIWYDSVKQRTPYSVVYLHGFSASQEEGDPIHAEFAKRYGCNLYLPRLEGHGRADTNSFIDLTPESYMKSASEAIAIGQLLGDNVIVMSCSTGSTLSAYLAANNPGVIHSQIMYSPNIDLADPTSDAILMPWGKNILEMVIGGENNHVNYTPLGAQYWNETYHINGIIVVKDLINKTMKKEIWNKTKTPIFLGYYYKNEEEQDHVVSVPAMKEYYNSIPLKEPSKTMLAFPNVGKHVMASHVQSKDIESVMEATFNWADRVLKLPVPSH